MNKTDKQKIKTATMGCWWPSKNYPDMKPAWDMITDELLYLADMEKFRENYNGEKEFLRLSALAKLEQNF